MSVNAAFSWSPKCTFHPWNGWCLGKNKGAQVVIAKQSMQYRRVKANWKT